MTPPLFLLIGASVGAIISGVAFVAYVAGQRSRPNEMRAIVTAARDQALLFTPARHDESQAEHDQRVEFEAFRIAGAELCRRVDEEMGNG